jgi:hypothetical protein
MRFQPIPVAGASARIPSADDDQTHQQPDQQAQQQQNKWIEYHGNRFSLSQGVQLQHNAIQAALSLTQPRLNLMLTLS